MGLRRKGIEQELHELGYTTVGGSDPDLISSGVDFDSNDPRLNKLDNDVGCVLCGLVFNLNYLKLSLTLQYLLKDKKKSHLLPLTSIPPSLLMESCLLVLVQSLRQ